MQDIKPNTVIDGHKIIAKISKGYSSQDEYLVMNTTTGQINIISSEMVAQPLSSKSTLGKK